MSSPLLAFLSALLILSSYVLTGLVRRYALKQLIDVPNARSSHQVPTPRGGGLAILIVFLSGCAALAFAGRLSVPLLILLSTGLPIGLVGFWDDHGHLSARFRIAAHVAAAGAALALLDGFSVIAFGAWSLDVGRLGTAFALLWLVWLLNLFNFMDGIDAIAGTEVIFVAVGAAVLMAWRASLNDELVVVLLVLASATMGFQFWNWPPAKIFMGDVGSGFVGYMLALLALVDLKSPGGGLGLAVWLILNGLFLVDATYTLLRRIVSGQEWHQPHRSHAYQKAATKFGGHRSVVKSCLWINLFWLFPLAASASFWPDFGILITVIALAPLLGFAVLLKAGQA